MTAAPPLLELVEPGRWGAGPLRGFFVETPYGWGICNGDEEALPHLQVALDWRIRDGRRVQCAVRRSDIKRTSFCAVGQCVQTTFGTGVLLSFRPSDGVHVVQLWGRPSMGRNHAYLRRDALLAVLPAAKGLAVKTPYGPGVCRGFRDDFVLVDLGSWGRAELRRDSVRCPAALVLPLVDHFLARAAELLKLHSSTLARLHEALQGLGLEKLQERLTASAGEAMEVASKLWEEWEDRGTPDGASVLENLNLKAEEVLEDPQMKSAFQAGIARLNTLVCKAEGFDGVWLGKNDQGARCVISDANMRWHWGAESELEIWGANSVSTLLEDEIFRGELLPDGTLRWSDGDEWLRKPPPPPTPQEQAAAAAAAAAAPEEETPANSSVRSNLSLLQRSLQDLRRIVGGSGVEGDVEEALAELKKLAISDSEVQRVVDDMTRRRELILDLRGKLLQSKTGQVLTEGKHRLAQQLAKIQEKAITPQLERMQQRSSRFFTRITTDKTLGGKASKLFSGAQSRIMERLKGAEGQGLEAWVGAVKERVIKQLSVHKAMLVESLEGFDVKDLDLRRIIAASWDPRTLEEQLEKSMLRALEVSGLSSSGTELLDRFLTSSSSVAQIPGLKRGYQSLLSALAELNVEVPGPIQKLLEAQANGSTQDAKAWQEAIVSSLDDQQLVSGANALLEKGESVLAHFEELKGMNTVAKVFDHFENEDLEREVLKRLQSLDPDSLLQTAETAVSSAEAREQLLGQLKDACLDFVLKILPAIHIEKVEGTDNGCDWEISDISFSDFSFRKENVEIVLGKPALGEDLLRVSAWDISAHFRKLKVRVKQTSFPKLEASGIADAKAEKMSVKFAFRLDQGLAAGGQPIRLSDRSVHMETLQLRVGESNYAAIINTLTYLFANVLKDYASRKIAAQLDEHVGSLVGALNSVLANCSPLLAKVGIVLPGINGDVLGGTAQIEELPEDPPAEEEQFPAELDWPDPGSFPLLRA